MGNATGRPSVVGNGAVRRPSPNTERGAVAKALADEENLENTLSAKRTQM